MRFLEKIQQQQGGGDAYQCFLDFLQVMNFLCKTQNLIQEFYCHELLEFYLFLLKFFVEISFNSANVQVLKQLCSNSEIPFPKIIPKINHLLLQSFQINQDVYVLYKFFFELLALQNRMIGQADGN